MYEFHMIDVWWNEHPMFRAYTRTREKKPVISRLDYILVFFISNLADNASYSGTFCGFKSDHSIVKCKISVNESPNGKSYWLKVELSLSKA